MILLGGKWRSTHERQSHFKDRLYPTGLDQTSYDVWRTITSFSAFQNLKRRAHVFPTAIENGNEFGLIWDVCLNSRFEVQNSTRITLSESKCIYLNLILVCDAPEATLAPSRSAVRWHGQVLERCPVPKGRQSQTVSKHVRKQWSVSLIIIKVYWGGGTKSVCAYFFLNVCVRDLVRGPFLKQILRLTASIKTMIR